MQSSPSDVGVTARLLAGCTTGAMAVLFAQPTDVVKVRLQAQTKCQGCAKRYTGTLHAYKTIAREEGFNGLWKGRLGLTWAVPQLRVCNLLSERLKGGGQRLA